MLFFSTKPTKKERDHYLSVAGECDFSYAEVGATETLSGTAMARYKVDRYKCLLGLGQERYEAAKRALRTWGHFDLGWVHVEAPEPVPGLTVPVVIRVAGIWTLHFTRVVYVTEETTEDASVWAFAYGTLPMHGERGEERFQLTHVRKTDEVYYEICAFSAPAHPLAWMGYPFTRFLQRRFGTHSMKAMQKRTEEAAGRLEEHK